MLFNSLFFIGVFLPIVAIIFFLLGRSSHHLAGLWLCAASLFFYGWWNINYLWLLVGSVIFNYGAGYLIGHSTGPRAKRILAFAVTADLLLLGYYKYTNFFLASANHALGTGWSWGNIILPLGISFFTFTQIAFLVDTHRGKAREYNFVHYLLFVTYFPHLIAGPILHHAQMMPQFALRQTYRLNWANLSTGTTIFLIGLGKKLFLADHLSQLASPIFNGASRGISPLFLESWVGALAYTLQLYFDFSGYTDMAIGISYMFNIRLPLNFNSPYKAVNIIDFWRRWHMTLSAFLRDYLYIPLGGNRRGSVRRYGNLMATMLLGGLWHGAGWTFVIWGGLHGLFLVVNHAFHSFRTAFGWKPESGGRIGRLAGVGLTFLCVVVAWVFFRANHFSTAGHILLGMAGRNGIVSAHGSLHSLNFAGGLPLLFFANVDSFQVLTSLVPALAIIWALPNTQEWMQLVETMRPRRLLSLEPLLQWQPARWWTWAVFGVIFAVSLLTLSAGKPSEFLYFQF